MRVDVVDAAREWIGTPYRHQASLKGVGADCLGLLRGVWRELHHAEPAPIPAYTKDWSEPSGDEVLLRAAKKHLVVKHRADAAIGDVLLFRMRAGSVAKHLGIQGQIGPVPTFIHAYSGHAVLESTFGDPWQRRVVARFAFPKE